MSINANNAALNEILEAINELPEAGGGKTEIETTVDIASNGTTEVTPEDENTTLSKVTINVDVPIKDEQSKTIDITENGTITVAPDDGVVWNEVTVNTAIESSSGEDDFIGIKYSDFDSYRNIPKVADARSLDKTLGEVASKDDIRHALTYAFANSSKSGNGGYFAYLEEVYLPSKVTALMYTFYNCSGLTTIHGDLSNITDLNSTFFYCTSLDINAIIARMPNLKSIGGNTFYGCTQVTEITLPATIASITTSAFNGCTNLTKINCLFAEGSIKGQPWGATNAVVEYVTGV
jgi:hypothetical protein